MKQPIDGFNPQFYLGNAATLDTSYNFGTKDDDLLSCFLFPCTGLTPLFAKICLTPTMA